MRKVSLTILSVFFVIAMFSGFAMAQAQDQGSQEQNQAPDRMDEMGQPQDQEQGADQDRFSHHRWWERPRMVEKLNLTDDERDRIRAIYDRNSPELDKMRSDVMNQGKQLKDMLSQDSLDESAIAKQIDALSASRAELFKAELHMNAAMMNELTPDQRKQLIQMHEQWLEKMKQRKEARTGTNGAAGTQTK